MRLALDVISPQAAEALRRLSALGQGPLPCPVSLCEVDPWVEPPCPVLQLRRVRRENVQAARPSGAVVVVRRALAGAGAC